MKKVVFAAAFATMFATVGFSQIEESSVELIPTQRGSEPAAQALQDVKNDIKMPQDLQYMVKALLKKNPQWLVEQTEQAEDNTTFNRYELRTKSGHTTTDVTLDREGNILQFVQITEGVTLPKAVEQSLQTRYPNWKLLASKEVYNQFAKNDEVFSVKIKKGMLVKHVRFDEHGSVLN